jgi:hypothetical protein
VLLTGSTVTGDADAHSDLDLILYHDALPAEAAFAAARDAAVAGDFTMLAPASDDAYMETFKVDGVVCQLGHETVAHFEGNLRTVLVDLHVDTPVQKAIEGLVHGEALHGDELIARWKAEAAAYPDALRLAMVETHWRKLFPLWYVEDRLPARDTELWRTEMLIDNAYALLGVLAGLNRVYYSSFQFKRLRTFVEGLAVAPPRLAERIETLLDRDAGVAIGELESLVTDTQALVREHLPAADIGLRRPPGERHPPFAPLD